MSHQKFSRGLLIERPCVKLTRKMHDVQYKAFMLQAGTPSNKYMCFFKSFALK